MTSKHTPGPWSVGNGSRATGFTVKIASDELLVGGSGLTSEANARLIAAAPELLEALVEAVACGMVPITSASDGGAATHSRHVRCADQIRAAIAKATGAA